MRRASRRKPELACAAGFAGVIVLLAAGCSSPASPPGQQAAQNTRIAVAREYWRVLAVINPELFQGTGGSGSFSTCQPGGGGAATQVAYGVENGILSQNGRLAPGPFTAELAQLLHAHGWSTFASRNGALVGTSGDYRVTLKPVSDNASLSADLTVSGPCVTVGSAFASAAPHMTLNDDYANADVSASPTPTSPLPTP